MRHGNGVLTFANGDKYEGNFENNEIHGKGKYTWTTGDVFEGNFKDGKMNQGDCWYSIGVKGSGIFDENKLDFEPVEVPMELSIIETKQELA